MITVNIFHSALDDTYTTHQLEENVSIREAFPDLDFENAIIAVNGVHGDVTADTVLKDSDICAIRLFPEGEPADWWAGAAIGFLVVTAVFNFWNPGGWAAAGILLGGMGTGALIFGGASAAGYSLTGYLRGSDTDLKSADQIESIPQIRGARNQSAANKPIPIVLGKHLYTPEYIGKPYTTIGGVDGEDQYFHCLYLFGYGQLRVTNIQLGPIHAMSTAGNTSSDGTLPIDATSPFADGNPVLELQQGASEVSLYPQKVTEEPLQIELMHTAATDTAPEYTLKVDRFTDPNPHKVQIEFQFPNGLLHYNDEGDKENASVSIKVLWRRGPEDTYKAFGQIGTSGGDSPTIYDAETGITTITRAKNKVLRFVAEHTFPWADIAGVASRALELHIERTNAQATDTQTSDKVYLTAIRTWAFDYEKSAAESSMIPQVPMIEKYRDMTCRLGFRIKATQDLNGILDQLNAVVESYARTWNGSEWSTTETPTSNPASLALKILQSPSLGPWAYVNQLDTSTYRPDWCKPRTRYDSTGTPYTIKENRETLLDLDSFGEFFQWCESRQYYADGTLVTDTEKFACNGVLTTEKRVDEMLTAILSVARASRIPNGNKYAILIDRPRPMPVTILNNRNVLEATNQKSFKDLPDGYSIKFLDESNGYQLAEGYVMRQSSSYPQGYAGATLPESYAEAAIEKIDIPWVTNWRQVVKLARYKLKVQHIRSEIWNRKVSVDGYLIGIGSMVGVQDDTIVVGIGDGAEIKELVTNEDGDITGIVTDGTFEVTDAEQAYGLSLVQYDGVNNPQARIVEVAFTKPGTYAEFELATPIAESDAIKPSMGDNLSFGIIDKITISALCFGKKSSGDGKFDLAFTPYDESIYDDSGIIGELDTKITPPRGAASIQSPPVDILTRANVIDLSKTYAGKSAVHHELVPSVRIIKKDNDGVKHPDTISCEQYMIVGDTQEESDKHLYYATSLAPSEVPYVGPVTVGEWGWIKFLLYDDDRLLTFEEIPVLADGTPATTYQLIPSASVIRVLEDGTIDPEEISCEQYSTTGAGLPETSHKTLVYVTSTTATETVYTGPVEVAPSWTWIEFRLYDGATLLQTERVGVVVDGTPATVYEVVPSETVIRKKADGTIEPATITCFQHVTVGNTPPIASSKTLVYVTSAGGGETAYSGAVTINPVWTWIEFRLKDGATILTRRRVSALSDGAPSVASLVIPSKSTITKDSAGVIFPAMISCEQMVTVGNGTPEPSNKTLKYITSAGSETAYTGPITVDGSWEWIEFRLYDDAVLLAAENVPVLVMGKDGADAIRIDLLNERKLITCYIDGVPIEGQLPYTTKATLYRGQISISAASEYAANSKKRIYPYAGSGTVVMSPIPTLLYPVSTAFIHWSIPNAPAGVSIDANGNITVADGAELSENDELQVKATYNGQTYTIIFSLQKLCLAADGVAGIPGADGITYYSWLRYADDAAGHGLSNDPTGKTYIGLAYNKISPVESSDPADYSWSLIKGADGLDGEPGADGESKYTWIKFSDNPDGTGLYNEPTETTKYIGLAVNKDTSTESEDKTEYVWSPWRGDDGTSPVMPHLSVPVKQIACDRKGIPLAAALPFTCQAKLFRGTTEITHASELPVLLKKVLLYAGAGMELFRPGVGAVAGYPIAESPITWSLIGAPPSGITIDRYGLITVAKGAALTDANEILVQGVYEGRSYQATLNLTKQYPGAGALHLELESETVLINCDEYGDPLLDRFPVRNRAWLFLGSDQMDIVTWSLEGAPAGVSINSMGIIQVVWGLDYKDRNEVTVKAAFEGKTRTALLALTKAYAGVDPVRMDIDQDSPVVQCDGYGTPKSDQFPITVKATLYKGNDEITDTYMRPRLWRKRVVSYPGSGAALFVPGVASIAAYPVSHRAVVWALTSPPAGISIDDTGTITIAANATLSEKTNLEVNAFFQDEARTYTKTLTVSKVRDGIQGQAGPAAQESRYRGWTTTAPTDGTVMLNDVGTFTVNPNDWILYRGSPVGIWTDGYLYQWSGTAWIKLATEKNTTKYLGAINDITGNAPPGIFSDLFARMLLADSMAAQLIKVGNAIFGGPRFGDDGVDTGSGKGFRLGADGSLHAIDAFIEGIVQGGSLSDSSGFLLRSSDGYAEFNHVVANNMIAVNTEMSGLVEPTRGIMGAWYWGAATNRTQDQWFQVFKDRIPVGKRLNVFGGGRIINNDTGGWDTGVFCFIERLDANRIELNMFPISTNHSAYLTIVPCENGNETVVSSRHYFGW